MEQTGQTLPVDENKFECSFIIIIIIIIIIAHLSQLVEPGLLQL